MNRIVTAAYLLLKIVGAQEQGDEIDPLDFPPEVDCSIYTLTESQ